MDCGEVAKIVVNWDVYFARLLSGRVLLSSSQYVSLALKQPVFLVLLSKNQFGVSLCNIHSVSSAEQQSVSAAKQ